MKPKMKNLKVMKEPKVKSPKIPKVPKTKVSALAKQLRKDVLKDIL